MADLTLYFDPICPWAWRTFLWLREVRKERPLEIDWKLFSLKQINREDTPADASDVQIQEPHRALAMARRVGGNEAVERLYVALGQTRHERRENLSNVSVIEAAFEEAGLDRSLVRQALDDPSIYAAAAADHRESVQSYDAFGVPWLVLTGQRFGFLGPIISEVPQGQAALELWEHTAWFLAQPSFYEIKRSR